MPTLIATSRRLAPLLLLCAIAAVPGSVSAEGTELRVMADLEYLYSDIKTEDKPTGEESEQTFSYFRQRYNLNLTRELFPFLQFRAGGLFELIDSSVHDDDGPDAGYDQQSTWVFSELNLNNPLYTGGLAYRRREFQFDPDDFPDTTVHREEYTGLFRWTPVGLPLFDFDYSRYRTWDDEDTRDLRVERLFLKTRYEYRDLGYDYTYTRVDTDEHLQDRGDLTQFHDGGITYSRLFFGDRLQANAGVRLRFDSVEPRNEGELERPATPSGSEFYLLDDNDPTTLQAVDAANPLTAVNIGRNAPLVPVAVGLAFGPPTDVDTLHVLPLQDATDPLLASPGEIAAVAGFYVWTVFTSDDQMNWTEHTVTQATYDVFENRFDISFSPPAVTPYIKVVTTPLPSAPGEIRVAQVQAFETIPLTPGMVVEDSQQIVNVGLRWAVTDRTTASYDGYFRHQEAQPSDIRRTTLSNGLSLAHTFSPIFYANARVLRSDISESNLDDIVEHSYSASLTADWFDTFGQTLVYSGRHSDLRGIISYSNSVFLRSDADLYQGWSANLDLGYSWLHPQQEPDNSIATMRLATTIDPNPKLSFTIDYLLSLQNQQGEASKLDQNARFQGFWVPLRTLSFFASVQLRNKQSQDEDLEVAQDYAVNWAPFPDGTLNLSLAYNQNVDTDGNKTRAFSPQINWRIVRNTVLNVRFNIGTLETDREKRDIKNVRAMISTFY